MINVIDNMFFISSPAAVGAEEYHAMAAKMDVVDAFARITNQGFLWPTYCEIILCMSLTARWYSSVVMPRR